MARLHASLASLCLLGGSACDAAATDPSFWDRSGSVREVREAGSDEPGEEFDAGATPPDLDVDAYAPTPAEGGPCLTVQMSTLSYRGEYAPENVGALWISRPDGTFVRTLEAWGVKRLKHAIVWQRTSGGNKVDAISSATRRNHGAHTAVWDCKDAQKTAVSGAFVLHVEFTEENSSEGDPPGPHREFSFDTNAAGPLAASDDTALAGLSGTVHTP